MTHAFILSKYNYTVIIAKPRGQYGPEVLKIKAQSQDLLNTRFT